MKNLLTSCSLFLVGIICCFGQTVISEDVRQNIKARVDAGTNPGIVVGFTDGGPAQYFSLGVRSLKTKEPVDENSVFEIGSITKTFTGILLADNVVSGTMKLDDPLQNYLPNGVTSPERNGSVIRLVNLSNHTSSLPRMPDNLSPADPTNPFADYSDKLLHEYLTTYKLTRDIGSQYEYSNYAAGLLGNVLAARSGKSYEQLMTDVIAKPLDLKDTRITFTPNMTKNLAQGYSSGAEVKNWDFMALAGAGAIRSTAVDMMKYLSANMGMIKTNLYPAMQLSHTNTRAAGAAPMVGLGWHIARSGTREIVWHNGGTGGYRAFAGFVKGTSKAVVVLTNSDASVDDIGMHLLDAASPLTDIKPVVPVVTVDNIVLKTYVGKYQLAPSFVLTVTLQDSQLLVQATGQPNFPVFAKSNTEFFYKVVDAQLTFTVNKDKAVESVTLHQGGRDMVAKKIE